MIKTIIFEFHKALHSIEAFTWRCCSSTPRYILPRLRRCLHEGKLSLVGGYPGPRVNFLQVFTWGKPELPFPLWLWGNWEEWLVPYQTFSYCCTLSGLKSTELNSHGHLYCFKQLIKDWIIAEVKAHLLSSDFADDLTVIWHLPPFWK